MCRILRITGDRITLSLDVPKPYENIILPVGQMCNGTVEEISDLGMTVSVGRKNVLGFVPILHVCENYSLAGTMLRKYEG